MTNHIDFKTDRLQNLSKKLEDRGIDPRTSHMLSERSTIWARPPMHNLLRRTFQKLTILEIQ